MNTRNDEMICSDLLEVEIELNRIRLDMREDLTIKDRSITMNRLTEAVSQIESVRRHIERGQEEVEWPYQTQTNYGLQKWKTESHESSEIATRWIF